MSTRPGVEDAQAAERGRAAAAFVAVVALVSVVPLLLMSLTRALPLDPSALAPGAWSRADDGALLLFVLLGVAWSAWAIMVLSVALEFWAVLRRTVTPRLPGLALPQRLASGLVAALVVSLTAPAGSAVPAPADVGSVALTASATGPVADPSQSDQQGPGRLEAVVQAARVSDEVRSAPDARPGLEQPRDAGVESSRSAADPDLPTVNTKRHGTLWLLAEQYLGVGERYTEIVELNRGVRQPDGRALRDDGRVYPGWLLSLPPDAVLDSPRSDRHRVVAGDSLWAIADEELGDGTRYREIAELNEGDRQRDGTALRDPDLIRPGWVLELPDDGGDSDVSPADRTPDGAASGTAEHRLPSIDEPGLEPGPALPPASPGDSAGIPGSLDRGVSGSNRRHSPDAADLPRSLDRGVSTGAGRSSGNTDDPPRTLDRGVTSGSGRSPDEPTDVPHDPAPDMPDSSTESAVDGSGGPVDPAGEARDGHASAPEPRPTSDLAAGGLSHDSEPTAPDRDSGLAVLAGGGALTSLLLAGLGLELVRRRRQYQRHRQPGERMSVPPPRALDTERAARSALRLTGPELLQRSLAALAVSADHEARRLPDVRLVRLGTDSVVLELATPMPDPLPPFRALTPLRWVLARDSLAVSTPVEGPRAFPGLVTIGTTGPQTILLNMESVGTLTLSGSEGVLAGVCRGLAAELAYGPASQTTERTVCLADSWVAATLEAGSMNIESDPGALNALLNSAMQMGDARADAGADAGTGAGEGAATAPAPGTTLATLDSDPLQIVLSDQPVSARVTPYSGCALVTTAEVADPGASLLVDDSGAAALLPEQERLTPQTLGAVAAEDLVSLLVSTDVPAGVEPSPSGAPTAPGPDVGEAGGVPVDGRRPGDSSDPVTGTSVAARVDQPTTALPDVIDLRDGPERETEPGHEQREPATTAVARVPTGPRVLVLGQVEVENARGKAESTRIGRLAETAAFVLLQPGARPSELQAALWPGRRSNPQTCRQMISRTRTWLGRTADGTTHLLPLAMTEGRLRLGAEVSSDWAEFQQLAEVGLGDPKDVEHLEAALHLVRGRPFGTVASRELPWADLHINEMISAITDVAHELAVRHERAGRRSAAHAAALRGLLTECEAEILEEVARRTAP